MSRAGGAVVLDIEGTVSSLSYVQDSLFPYSLARIADWVRRDTPQIRLIAGQVRQLAGKPAAGLEEISEILCRWVHEDVKAAPLKQLQGLIWAAGFAAGELTAHVYDDVPAALREWSAHGQRLYIYSSGSVLAQRAFLRGTQHGNLLPFFSGHFDTDNAGPKKEPGSYVAIAAALRLPADRLTFYSDSRDELDAAAGSGWRAVGVHRCDNPSAELGSHPVIAEFGHSTQYGHREVVR